MGDWVSSPQKPCQMGILKDYSLNRWKIRLTPFPRQYAYMQLQRSCSKFITALTRTELVILIPGNMKGWSNATRRQTQDLEKRIEFCLNLAALHWPAMIGFYCWYSVTARIPRKMFTFVFSPYSSCLVSSWIRSQNQERSFILLVKVATSCFETREPSCSTAFVFF